MNPTHPHDPRHLDAQLREGARTRRAWLEQQAYPIADYPPRPRKEGATITSRHEGPGWAGWLLGLGLPAAVIALAAALWWAGPAPLAPAPAPIAVGDSVRALLARLGDAETAVNRGATPLLRQASSLPGKVQQWPALIDQASRQIEEPYEAQWQSLQADLRHAADYLRRLWQESPAREPSPTGANPPAAAPSA